MKTRQEKGRAILTRGNVADSHTLGKYMSIERSALGLRLYFNALGHSSPNQIGSEIAYSWPM
jgi:hypothetical protein